MTTPTYPVREALAELVRIYMDAGASVTSQNEIGDAWIAARSALAAQPAAQPLTDERIDDIARHIWPQPRNSLPLLRLFARAVLAAQGKKP